VHWAKAYLVQAGLVEATRRAHFRATERGVDALRDGPVRIDMAWLERFPEFNEFRKRTRDPEDVDGGKVESASPVEESETPDDLIQRAYVQINAALAGELLSRIRSLPPAFFERLIVRLLIAMGYGGTADDAGRALGASGDGGIDGVIDQDLLGVDQIYLQAKRYAEDNVIGPGAVREFYGALSLRRASKGIFVTTSAFSRSARDTAANLGARIVLIDGVELAQLMIRHDVGCREEKVVRIKRIDEGFFEEE
jgi:restriction system protein